MNYNDELTIIKGSRHCRILNQREEVVFRTTNLRDAEIYLRLIDENRRLHKLLEARGVAPHRIYHLECGEIIHEVVIVAKADCESVVVRHLSNGKEEIVDLDDLSPLEGGNYFLGSETPVETVHVLMRYNGETEAALIEAYRTHESTQHTDHSWRRSFQLETDNELTPCWSENGVYLFKDEIVIKE